MVAAYVSNNPLPSGVTWPARPNAGAISREMEICHLDYPMVAQQLAALRSAMAKKIGLGQIPRKAGVRKSSGRPTAAKAHSSRVNPRAHARKRLAIVVKKAGKTRSPPRLGSGNNLALVVVDCLARSFLAPQPKRANLPRGKSPSRGAFFVGRLASRGLSGSYRTTET